MDAMNTRRIAIYGFGHLVTDLVSGCIPGLLLLYSQTHPDWSYVALSSIWLAMSLSNAIFQPLWGSLADRVSIHLMMPLGLVASTFGIVLVGFAGSYDMVVLGSAICGLGSSAFHPDAQHAVHQNAHSRPGVAMSLFQVMGNFGMAVGPLVVALLASPQSTTLVGLVGLPALVGAVLLMFDAHRRWRAGGDGLERTASAAPAVSVVPAARPAAQPPAARRTAAPVSSQPPSLPSTVTRLLGIITMRGFAQTALGFYLSLYYQHAYGWSPDAAQYLLFAYLGAGAIGTVFGGYWADKLGERRVIMLSMTALFLPALLVRVLPPVPGVAFMIVCGFIGMSTWSVITVYSQKLYPRRVGMISGMMTGFTIGMAGITSEVLGVVADAIGLAWVITLGVIVIAPGSLLTMILPEPTQAENRERQSDTAAV